MDDKEKTTSPELLAVFSLSNYVLLTYFLLCLWKHTAVQQNSYLSMVKILWDATKMIIWKTELVQQFCYCENYHKWKYEDQRCLSLQHVISLCISAWKRLLILKFILQTKALIRPFQTKAQLFSLSLEEAHNAEEIMLYFFPSCSFYFPFSFSSLLPPIK